MRLAIWFDTETEGYDLGEPAVVIDDVEEPEDGGPIMLETEQVTDLLQAWVNEADLEQLDSVRGWTIPEVEGDATEFILAVQEGAGIFFASWLPELGRTYTYNLSGFPFALEAKAVEA